MSASGFGYSGWDKPRLARAATSLSAQAGWQASFTGTTALRGLFRIPNITALRLKASYAHPPPPDLVSVDPREPDRHQNSQSRPNAWCEQNVRHRLLLSGHRHLKTRRPEEQKVLSRAKERTVPRRSWGCRALEPWLTWIQDLFPQRQNRSFSKPSSRLARRLPQ